MMANASEEVYFATNSNVENTSHVLPSSLQRRMDAPPIFTIIVTWFTGVTGVCANAMVLVVLVFARRYYGSHVNTLIANQSAMDLFACIFLFITLGIMKLPSVPKYDFGLGEVGNILVCYLFKSTALAVSCKNAGIFGLVMIYSALSATRHWQEAQKCHDAKHLWCISGNENGISLKLSLVLSQANLVMIYYEHR